MSILILNGSPKKSGYTSRTIKIIADNIDKDKDVEWIDVYGLNIKPCIGCMKCRPDGVCVLPADDGHRVGKKISAARALVVGTPTYWGNMSGPLKVLFDRNVPVFEYIGKGFPIPRQKGKKAIIVTAAASPWPYSLLGSQAGGTIRALRTVLQSGGYRILGSICISGTMNSKEITGSTIRQAQKLARRL